MKERPPFVTDMIERIRTQHGEEQAQVAERLAEWADARGLTYRQNPNDGWGPSDDKVDGWSTPFTVFATTPRVDVQLGNLREGNPFRIEDRQQELRQKLESLELEGLDTKTHPWFPNIGLEALSEPEPPGAFLDVMDWILERVRASNRSSRK